MSPLQQPLVAQLRSAYHESGLTYEQIAARAEVTPQTVCRALNGRPVTTVTLLRLCHVLKRTIQITTA